MKDKGNMKEAYQYLLDELESSCLNVILIPAPEQRHYCHMIRVADSVNAKWYRDLCRKNCPLGTGKKTRIRRQDIISVLKKLIQGKETKSQYKEQLERIAKQCLEKQNH